MQQEMGILINYRVSFEFILPDIYSCQRQTFGLQPITFFFKTFSSDYYSYLNLPNWRFKSNFPNMIQHAIQQEIELHY